MLNLRFKRHIVYFVGIAGSALTLFSNLGGIISFAEFVNWLMSNWLLAISYFWTSLLFFLPGINRVDATLLTMLSFTGISLYWASKEHSLNSSGKTQVPRALVPAAIIGIVLAVGFSNARVYEACPFNCQKALKELKAEVSAKNYKLLEFDFFNPNRESETFCSFPSMAQGQFKFTSRQALAHKKLCASQVLIFNGDHNSYTTRLLNNILWLLFYHCPPEVEKNEGAGGCGYLEDEFRSQLSALYTFPIFFTLFAFCCGMLIGAFKIAGKAIEPVRLSRRLWSIVLGVFFLLTVNAAVIAIEGTWQAYIAGQQI